MPTGFTTELSPTSGRCCSLVPPSGRQPITIDRLMRYGRMIALTNSGQAEGATSLYVYACAAPEAVSSAAKRPLKGTAKHIVFDAQNGENRNDMLYRSLRYVEASNFCQLANFDSTQVSSPMGESKEVTSHRSPF